MSVSKAEICHVVDLSLAYVFQDSQYTCHDINLHGVRWEILQISNSTLYLSWILDLNIPFYFYSNRIAWDLSSLEIYSSSSNNLQIYFSLQRGLYLYLFK